MTPKYCMNCGGKLPAGGKFCPSCGTAFGKVAQTPVATQEDEIEEVPKLDKLEFSESSVGGDIEIDNYKSRKLKFTDL